MQDDMRLCHLIVEMKNGGHYEQRNLVRHDIDFTKDAVVVTTQLGETMYFKPNIDSVNITYIVGYE